MMLNETAPVATALLPVQEFKNHLRLGTGFADDGAEDALAEGYLRAAIAAVEGRTGKALIGREFLLGLTAWRWPDSQALPVAPVIAVNAVRLRAAGGGTEIVSTDRYRLMPDLHRPKIVATGALLPTIAAGGSAEIAFTAGFGAGWSDVPPDLAQAVFLLAADYHEHRHEGGPKDAMPFGVSALIERWRNVRVLGRGA